MASRGAPRTIMPSRFGTVGNPDAGSTYSDVVSDDGRNGVSASGRPSSSSKAQHLAGEIADIEQRCDYLEQRNQWLTERLLRDQKQFIERTMMGGRMQVLRHSLKAWCEALELLRFEKQLQQQIDDARKCQQVAKELGAALAREQEVSREHLAMRQQLETQFDELADTNAILKESSDKQAVQIVGLQRQITLIMGGLEGNKFEAQAIVDSVDQLQKKMRELKNDDGNKGSDPSPSRDRGESLDTIEESVKLRGETQSFVNSMSGLLKQVDSPDRDRRQPVKYQSTREGDRGGYPQSALRSTGGRAASPLDGRFQSVSEIADGLGQAPSITSGNDMLRVTRVSDNNFGQAGGARSSGERSPIFGRQAALSSVSSASAGRR